MTAFAEPRGANDFLAPHVACLLSSPRRWTGTNLVDPDLPSAQQARELFYAPFVVLSHNNALDPLLNYANRVGLELFELSWRDLVELPSRVTAGTDSSRRSRELAGEGQRAWLYR